MSRSKDYTFYPITHKEKERLELLGLAEKDYLCFRNNFVGHVFDFSQMIAAPDWRVIHGRLSNSRLIDHLEGKLWLGTGCRVDSESPRSLTQCLIIDLDRSRHPESDSDLSCRYQKVVKAIDRPSLLFQSSDSGGYHLYYFLTRPVELFQLRDVHGRSGTIVRLLNAAGMDEESSKVEIYPRGQYRQWGIHNRIRLPFGKESVLLDPHTCDRITSSPSSDLKRVCRAFEKGAIHDFDPDEFVDMANQLPRHKARRGGRRRPAARTGSVQSLADHEISNLRDKGLTGSGQFNSAVSRLAFWSRDKGMDRWSAIKDIQDWSDRRTNGQSTTYNRSRAGAHAEIADVVSRIYARPGQKWAPRPGLSIHEVESLLEATDRPIKCHEEEGTVENINLFKLQNLGFELLDRAKQWILTTAGEGLATRDSEGSREFSSHFESLTKKIWPDHRVPEFVVPVPYSLRMSIRGISESLQAPLWRALSQSGLFVPVTSGAASISRAATYRVTLDFEGLSEAPGTFGSIESALRGRLLPRVIRERYSRHYAARIAAASTELQFPGREGSYGPIYSRLKAQTRRSSARGRVAA